MGDEVPFLKVAGECKVIVIEDIGSDLGQVDILKFSLESKSAGSVTQIFCLKSHTGAGPAKPE